MLLLVTALLDEARPLGRALGLSREGREGSVRWFAGADYLLAVSGPGALRCAAVTSRMLTRFPQIRAACNAGVAGAAEGEYSIGQWVRVHSVRDEASDRLLIPDILDRHSLPEAALLTVGQIRRHPAPAGHVVDMEGSGFLEAARFFLPTDRVAVFKNISDYCHGEFNTETMAGCFAENAGAFPRLLKEWAGGLAEPAPDEPAGLGELQQVVTERLRLTETQRHQLARWLRGYLLRGGDAAAVLDRLPAQPVRDKVHGRTLFQEIRDVLAG